MGGGFRAGRRHPWCTTLPSVPSYYTGPGTHPGYTTDTMLSSMPARLTRWSDGDSLGSEAPASLGNPPSSSNPAQSCLLSSRGVTG